MSRSHIFKDPKREVSSRFNSTRLSRLSVSTLLAEHSGIADGLVLTDQQDEDGATPEDDEEVDEEERTQLLPWWRRPSPFWLIALLPFIGVATAATMAPRIEMYTLLACRVHRPDIFAEASPSTMTHLNADNRPCFSDPVVSAAVANLLAVMTTTTGVLSCLTTAWWGSFSDRCGRIRTLGILAAGTLIVDGILILVYNRSELLPGGYWFLVVGSLCDGAFGGHITADAAKQAYLADTTTAATRSQIFSLSTGVMFTGVALGPILGGVLMRSTHNPISVFYVAAFSNVFYTFMIWFVVPESLTSKKMRLAVKKQCQRAASATATRGVMPRLKRCFSFLSTLNVLGPSYHQVGSSPWSLTLVVISYALVQSIAGSRNNQFQYVSKTFGWTSETISYWMSLIGAIRAAFLMFILPLIIKIIKDKSKIKEVRPRISEEEPLIDRSNSSLFYHQRESSHSSSRSKEPHSSRFDLGLARFSLGLEAVSFAFLGLAMGSVSYTIAAILGAVGTGYGPALQSVALDLYGERVEGETGRFFGALSVLQVLSSQIVGPTIYGVVYAKTVATSPWMIFFVSAAFVAFSLVALTFVRLPREDRLVRGIQEKVIRHSLWEDVDHERQLPAGGPSQRSNRASV
ncbi:MFS general substrate transporter [Marasmius fiardii PR-910]|nr:MFS general substrate transporter [Marasmius fiardii PR-910]